MAQLTIVGGRGQSKTVEVVIVAGTLNPKVTLDGVDHIVEEAWCNLVLDVNALVVAHCIGIAAAVRGDGRPCADDAVATRANAVYHVVRVAQTCCSEVTVVSVRCRSGSRVAGVEVYVAQAIDIQSDVSWGIHRHIGLGVVLNRDDLNMECLVAEAIRSHPSAVQHAAAARRVRSRGLSHELNTNEYVVAIGKTSSVGVKSCGTTILAVITVVREEHHLIGGEVVCQPLIGNSAVQRDVITT